MSQTALPPPRRSRLAALTAVLGLVGSSAALVAGTAPAAAGGGAPPPQIFVETTDDVTAADGLISLREAFDLANSSGTPNQIVLQQDATYVLDDCEGGVDDQLNVGGDLDHTSADLLWLLGDGSTVEQTCTNERVIHDWLPDEPMFIEGVTITGGRTGGSGGGVLLGGGGQIVGSTIEGNTSGGPNGGGGVAAMFELSVSRSTIRDNVASGDGGGLRSFEAIFAVNSSIVGNTSAAAGGGASAGTEMVAINSTVTQNRAINAGGGLRSVAEETTVGQSTVVANRAPVAANVLSGTTIEVDGGVIALGSEGPDCESADPVLQNGGSVGYDQSCDGPGPNDLPVAHPMLAALAVPDGATTASMAPVVGSPVVDRFAACPVDFDQHDDDRPEGPACDAGAVEAAPPACSPTFTDVGGAHPFFDEICWLDQTGITSGYADGSFGAGQPVTRQAMAAFIYRLAMSPPPPLLPPTFSDVAIDHPFATEIGWLADEGISAGYVDGTFRPGDAVTRQAMAAFLFRVAGEPAILLPPAPTFNDVSEAHPFYGEIEWMSAAGVSTGYVDGTWQPAAPVTRQAMAAFLQRMAEDVDLDGL